MIPDAIFNNVKDEVMILAQEVANLINAAQLQSPPRDPSNDLDKEAFLSLLVKQLSYQDPLDPMKNEEFVSQLAAFGSLEQSINLNDSFNQFMTFQQLTQASTLIGKDVIAFVQTEDGGFAPAAGVVEQVVMVNGTPYLRLDSGDEVPLSSIISVERAGGSDNPDAPDESGGG